MCRKKKKNGKSKKKTKNFAINYDVVDTTSKRRQRKDDGRSCAISYSVSAHDRNIKFASGMPSSWLPSWCLGCCDVK